MRVGKKACVRVSRVTGECVRGFTARELIMHVGTGLLQAIRGKGAKDVCADGGKRTLARGEAPKTGGELCEARAQHHGCCVCYGTQGVREEGPEGSWVTPSWLRTWQ